MTYATYVYAVRRTGGPEIHSPGHDGGGPVRLLPLGSLTAVVQDVPAADFTEEALRERFTDHADLERCARTHHRVVSAAAAGAATVPLPLATLYANDVRTKVVLEEHAERLSEALHRVAGHVEWAVKVHRDGTLPLAEPDPAGSAQAVPARNEPVSGREYLARVRERRAGRERQQESALDAVDLVDRVARTVAVAAVRRPLHGVELTGRERPQVMNGAYLVPRDDERLLAAALDSLRGDPRLTGFAIEASGPWVPYSFASFALTEVAGRDGAPA
ncbi:GvpL/GvpF family gas vesicle protein [Streptomyces sp. NPDC058374]|uniref:GvpL/GvpF family gas vesicle protein n=1 Tax=Streptomyces sp. NPDC058374 TaxID=3346466 RepID=UPI00365DAE63